MQERDRTPKRPGHFRAEACDLGAFGALCQQQAALADYPHAADLAKSVLICDCPALAPRLAEPAFRQALTAEWAEALAAGPGVIVLRGAEPDHAMLDRASDHFRDLIDRQNRGGTGGAAQAPHRDHHLGFQTAAAVARSPAHVHLAALLHQALAEAWSPDCLAAALDAQAARRSA